MNIHPNFISAKVDVTSILPQLPNEEFEHIIYLNSENTLTSSEDSRLSIVGNSTRMMNVSICTNPPIMLPSTADYQERVSLEMIQVLLTPSKALKSIPTASSEILNLNSTLADSDDIELCAIDADGKYIYCLISEKLLLKIDSDSFNIVQSCEIEYTPSYPQILLSIANNTVAYTLNRTSSINYISTTSMTPFSYTGVEGSIGLSSGGLLDPSGGFLYNYTNPINTTYNLYKFDLVRKITVQTYSFDIGRKITCAAICPFADVGIIFGTESGVIVFFRLYTFVYPGAPSRVITISTSPGNNFTTIAMDRNGIYAYLGSNFGNIVIVRVDNALIYYSTEASISLIGEITPYSSRPVLKNFGLSPDGKWLLMTAEFWNFTARGCRLELATSTISESLLPPYRFKSLQMMDPENPEADGACAYYIPNGLNSKQFMQNLSFTSFSSFGNCNWMSVSCSGDGKVLMAARFDYVAPNYIKATYISQDSGQNWTATTDLPSWTTYCTTMSRSGNRLAYSTTNAVKYRDTVGMPGWTEVSTPGFHRFRRSLQITPSGGQIWLSTDLGIFYANLTSLAIGTWQPVPNPVARPSNRWTCVCSTGTIVFASDYSSASDPDKTCWVYKYSGGIWTRLVSFTPQLTSDEKWTALACSDDGSVICAVASSEILSEHPMGTVPALPGLAVVYISSNGGISWNQTEVNCYVQDIDCSATGELILVPTNQGLMFSTDFGSSWNFNSQMSSVGVIATNELGTNILCGTKARQSEVILYSNPNLIGPLGILIQPIIQTTFSSFGNRNWVSVSCSGDGKTLMASQHTQVITYGVYLSQDSGQSWTNLRPETFSFTTAISRNGKRLAYATPVSAGWYGVRYRDVDTMSGWIEISVPNNGIQIAGSNLLCMSAAGNRIWTSDSNNILYFADISSTGVGSWQVAAPSVWGRAFSSYCCTFDGTIAYCGSTPGVFKYQGGVLSQCNLAAANWSYSSIACSDDGQIVCVVDSMTPTSWTPPTGLARVYVSTDGGSSWVQTNFNCYITGISCSYNGKMILVPTNQGIMISQDFGIFWTLNSQVGSVSTVAADFSTNTILCGGNVLNLSGDGYPEWRGALNRLQFVPVEQTSLSGKILQVGVDPLIPLGLRALTNVSEKQFRCSVIDPLGIYAYFGGDFGILKIDCESFKRVGFLIIGAPYELSVAIIDSVGKFAYFVDGSSDGTILKLDLESFTIVDANQKLMPPGSLYNEILTGLIDHEDQFAYFTAFGVETYILKVALNDLQIVDQVEYGTQPFTSSAMDSTGRYLYFTSNIAPPKMYQVDLYDLTSFAISILSVDSSDWIVTFFIDESDSYGYFCSGRKEIVKFDLSRSFLSLTSETLEENEVEVVNFITLSRQPEAPALYCPKEGLVFFYDRGIGPGETNAVLFEISLDRFVVTSADSLMQYCRTAVVSPTSSDLFFGNFADEAVDGKIEKVSLDMPVLISGMFTSPSNLKNVNAYESLLSLRLDYRGEELRLVNNLRPKQKYYFILYLKGETGDKYDPSSPCVLHVQIAMDS